MHPVHRRGPQRQVFVAGVERRPRQPPIPLDGRNLVLLHQEAQPPGVLVNDGSLPRLHRGPVQLRRLDPLNPKLRRTLQVVPYLRVEQQRLGRNAAHMQAGPAQHVGLLNQRHLQPVLSATNRRRIPSRPAANDRHVINRLSQGELHFSTRCLSNHRAPSLV